MAKEKDLEWGSSPIGELSERWPRDEHGEPEEPVFLCCRKNIDLSDELLVNMLEAYGIPCLRRYPGDGSFGRLILGISGQGVDILVPKSLYNDAKGRCEGEMHHEEL